MLAPLASGDTWPCGSSLDVGSGTGDPERSGGRNLSPPVSRFRRSRPCRNRPFRLLPAERARLPSFAPRRGRRHSGGLRPTPNQRSETRQLPAPLLRDPWTRPTAGRHGSNRDDRNQPRAAATSGQTSTAAFDEVTVAANAVIGIRLESPVSSETSCVEDRVTARVTATSWSTAARPFRPARRSKARCAGSAGRIVARSALASKSGSRR